MHDTSRKTRLMKAHTTSLGKPTGTGFKVQPSRHLWRTAACAAALTLLAGAAQSATLRMVNGSVEVMRDGVTLTAFKGFKLKKGDVLQSAAADTAQPGSENGGEALVRFDDGARMALRGGSTVELQQLQLTGPRRERQKILSVITGALRYISGVATVRQKVSFVTSTATIGIRGTDIEIVVTPEAVEDNNPGTYLKVNTGAAVLTASDGAKVDVAPGEVAYGGEPELTSRGKGGTRRASARMVDVAASGVFKASGLDKMMK
jgi:OmpA-OmpF porin, OOP family